jgi:hypothetical protein
VSADVLRQAAALMRERAEAANTHRRWVFVEDDDLARPFTVLSDHEPGERTYVCENARYAGEHIASWHPAVALAVADWLYDIADTIGSVFVLPSQHEHAVAVARAYLGDPS